MTLTATHNFGDKETQFMFVSTTKCEPEMTSIAPLQSDCPQFTTVTIHFRFLFCRIISAVVHHSNWIFQQQRQQQQKGKKENINPKNWVRKKRFHQVIDGQLTEHERVNYPTTNFTSQKHWTVVRAYWIALNCTEFNYSNNRIDWNHSWIFQKKILRNDELQHLFLFLNKSITNRI